MAIDAVMNVGAEDGNTWVTVAPVTSMRAVPKDSLLALSAERSTAWLARLQASGTKGLQVDPYGMLAVMAHREEVAQQQIAARLAMPELSVTDRAFTLHVATVVFASVEFPARLPIAERYLKQLDALGPSAALLQYQARVQLMTAYYRLGRPDDVARIGVRALELVCEMPYAQRSAFWLGGAYPYGMVIDVLSGRPNGRATIRTLNTKLIAAATPSAELVAHDSSFFWNGQGDAVHMQSLATMSERVGRPGTPLVANYWVNRGTTRDSQTVAVNDGKIRIIEIGSFSCAPCVGAVPAFERLHRKYPGVEFNFMTWTFGYWGNRIVPAKVEAERLADHFLTNLHATFPIGIWLSQRVPTEDGGSVAQMESPLWEMDEYPQVSKPTLYILDGHGVIRRVILGFDRTLEETIGSIIEYLQKEQQTAPTHQTSSDAPAHSDPQPSS